jgi:hypothetical protein
MVTPVRVETLPRSDRPKWTFGPVRRVKRPYASGLVAPMLMSACT